MNIRMLAFAFLALAAILVVSPKASSSFTPSEAASVTATVNVSGSINNNQGVALCGLVLANGQFVFSCAPNGSYMLAVPLDASGQITLYGFAEGHFPYKAVLTSGGRHDMTLTVANSQPVNTNRDKSSLLLGGTWTYTYAIISTFSDRYSFTTITSTPDQYGDYFVSGTSSTGRAAVGFYGSRDNMWAVLSRASLFDFFYTFTFSGNNNVTGCYFQITPSGSTNIGRCYAMTGSRFPLKAYAFPEPSHEELRLIEATAVGATVEMGSETRSIYQRLKQHLQ